MLFCQDAAFWLFAFGYLHFVKNRVLNRGRGLKLSEHEKALLRKALNVFA